jgi:hypothetical protein
MKTIFDDDLGVGYLDESTGYRPNDTEPEPEPQPQAETVGAASSGRTPEGSESSRWNAVKHGLESQSLFPPDMQAQIDKHNAALTEQYSPANANEVWLVLEIARARAKIDRATELLPRAAQDAADRARDSWEEDRQAAARKLADRLPKRPEKIAPQLEATKQGCELMMTRWERLGEAAEVQGSWTEDLRTMAFDLLGIALEFRATSRAVPAGGDAPGLKVLVAWELARLRELRDTRLTARDQKEQAQAVLGNPAQLDAEVRRLLHYEAKAQRLYAHRCAELEQARALNAAARERERERQFAEIFTPRRLVPVEPAAPAPASAPVSEPVATPEPQAAVTPTPAPAPADAVKAAGASGGKEPFDSLASIRPLNRRQRRAQKLAARHAARRAAG